MFAAGGRPASADTQLLNTHSLACAQCAEKPKGDKYGFTHFARMMCDGKGLAPLRSDSRRRPDRAALEWGDAGTAGAEKYALEEMQRAERRVRARLFRL
jgi:hypothetical protein